MTVYSCENCVNTAGFAQMVCGLMCIDCGSFAVTEREMRDTEVAPEYDAPLIAHLALSQTGQVAELQRMYGLVDGRY